MLVCVTDAGSQAEKMEIVREESVSILSWKKKEKTSGRMRKNRA